MGFKLTWLSIKEKDRAAVFQDLGVRPEGPPITYLSEGTVGRPHGDDAYLVVAMNDHGRYIEPDLLRNLSRGAKVLACHVHEGCMYSHAAHWADGVEIWDVAHDSDQGIRHLDVRGAPPPELARIRAALEAAQDAEPPKMPRAVPEPMPSTRLSPFPPDLMQVIAQFRLPEGMPSMPSMGVDHIFDVPVDLCEALTGLRHDRASFNHGVSLEVLVPAT